MRSKGQVKTSFAVSPGSAISLSQTIQITHAVPIQPTVAGKRYALLAKCLAAFSAICILSALVVAQLRAKAAKKSVNKTEDTCSMP